MAIKSSISVTQDDGKGNSVTIQSDGANFLKLTVSTGTGTESISLDATSSHTIRAVMQLADALRSQAPTS